MCWHSWPRPPCPLYWQTLNFTVLHLVTGSRAAAIVARHLPAELKAPGRT